MVSDIYGNYDAYGDYVAYGVSDGMGETMAEWVQMRMRETRKKGANKTELPL